MENEDKIKTLKDIETEDLEEVNKLSTGNYEGLTYFKGRQDLFNELKTEAVKIHKLADDHYKFNREMPFMASWDRERKFLQQFLEWWC